MKRLDYTLFDEIEGKAKDSPRRRANYDLRTQAMDEDPAWCDTSQRMLNVLMKDSVVPVHRHTNSSETVVVLRGSGDEVFYDELCTIPSSLLRMEPLYLRRRIGRTIQRRWKCLV